VNFFQQFDGRLIEFTVYTPVSSEFRTYLFHLGWETANEFNLPQVAQDALAFPFTPPFESAVLSREKALDLRHRFG
jgi:hypothetical protein